MNIYDLRPAEGSTKKRKRVGRGIGSGHGKTSTRGHKGQKARTGGGVSPGFEGGQMPLQRRLPKRGFTALASKHYATINVGAIDRLGLSEITPALLKENGIVSSLRDGLKILGAGEITKPVAVKANAISASAEKKIKAAGGTVEVI